MSEQIEKLKEKMMHPNATSMEFIKRVPIKTVEAFKKFANDEFVGDYGMALKYLVDQVLIEPQPFQQIYSILQDHEQRLAKLEHTEPKKYEIKKMLNGREIKIPIKEE